MWLVSPNVTTIVFGPCYLCAAAVTVAKRSERLMGTFPGVIPELPGKNVGGEWMSFFLPAT